MWALSGENLRKSSDMSFGTIPPHHPNPKPALAIRLVSCNQVNQLPEVVSRVFYIRAPCGDFWDHRTGLLYMIPPQIIRQKDHGSLSALWDPLGSLTAPGSDVVTSSRRHQLWTNVTMKVTDEWIKVSDVRRVLKFWGTRSPNRLLFTVNGSITWTKRTVPHNSRTLAR